MKKLPVMNTIGLSPTSSPARPTVATIAVGVALLLGFLSSAALAVHFAMCGGMPLCLYASLAVCAACVDPLRRRL